MEYIASLSYGKDSIILPEVCMLYGLPLDRIVHVEIMATATIHADLPPMVEFKAKADKIIKERYGIEVEHLHAPKNYEEQFYKKYAKGKHVGNIYGFPKRIANWCTSELKTSVLRKLANANVTQYIGIAADEPKRFHNLNDRIISPLVEFGITEAMARQMAENLGLLSPVYADSVRGGCWFCHNQRLQQLRQLRHNYPEYWKLMLKWDSDSPVTFKPNGTTVHDLDRRFENEDNQICMWGKDRKL
ncbi:MAG: hypothetical protein RR444_05030 [Oscillospiraceae bacterium]